MSGFTQSVKKTFEFDGDTIAVTMKRIKRKHMLWVGPLIPQNREPTTEESLNILSKICEFIDGYVVEFSGLTDEDGEPIAFELVLEEAYFQELLADIAAWWFEASQMGKKPAGKSKGQRRGGSGG